jgi:plastocyanin
VKRSLNVLMTLSVIAGMLAVTGCGSKSTTSPSAATPATSSTASAGATSSGGGGGTKLNLSADAGGAIAFNTTTLSAKAGNVTIAMSNPSSTNHGIAIEGNGVNKVGTGGTSGVPQGQTATVTAKLKPGTYTFYCPVDGHKASGMQGTLTVK